VTDGDGVPIGWTANIMGFTATAGAVATGCSSKRRERSGEG
jgi:hypothetical protein